MKVIMFILLAFVISGCSSIQDKYRPLYQAEPEKEAIEVIKT